jgi:pyruvate-formate lyase
MARQATGLSKIIIFSCQSFPSIKDLTIWASLLRGYFDLGGLEVSYMVVGKEVLLDAQQHPEKYPGLVVRVAGYSAFFVELSKEVQDTIIDRVEHTW